MAFKPYCQECATWHTEKEGHITHGGNEDGMRGLVNGIGGTVMELDQEKKWPDQPSTPHDIIACHFRNWGWNLAHRTASELLQELQQNGWHLCKVTHTKRKPFVIDDDEAEYPFLP